MAQEELEIDKIIAQIEAENSPSGLFTRYAHTRVRGLIERQVMAMSAIVAFAAFFSVAWAAVIAVLAILGEAIELTALRGCLRALSRGASIRSVQIWSITAGVLQALSLAAIVAIASFVPDAHTEVLCFAILSMAAMNVTAVKSLYKAVVYAKLFIFGVTAIAVMTIEIVRDGGFTTHTGFNFLALAALAYMIFGFEKFAAKNFNRTRQYSHDLLQRQRTVELAAQELREKQKELRMLSMAARHANDSVILCDGRNKITWINEAFSRSTGFTLKDAAGKIPTDLQKSSNTEQETIEELKAKVAAGQAFRGELLNKRKDGSELWVETNIVPILHETGEIEMIVAVDRDVTLAKQHEHDLAMARLEAERGDRAKSEFLATMSHEIRTPMNGVIGMSELLCESDLDKQQKMYARTIQSSAQALLKIINDILDFSKLDAGKLTIDPIDFSPGKCINDAVDILRPKAEEKGLFVDVSFETRLPSKVFGDDGRMRQILINLIGNAVKFTDAGGVSVVIRHSDVTEGHAFVVKIKDSGVGIAADKLDEIFSHFSQADAATTRRFGGTGLGLSISRLLARRMGGDITVTSTYGDGSEFCVELQFGEAQGVKSRDNEAVEIVDPESLRGMRVLLAEDNKTNQILVTSFLAGLDLDLVVVENGALAAEAVATQEFDAVLMDMSMPVMDGLEATRLIRKEQSATLPIVALTANAFASDRKVCLEAGMSDFLSKPVKKKDLWAALARANNNGELADPALRDSA